MKLRRKSKILAAAIAMMSLSTAAAVTGTVAWFSANNLVSVTGMAVKTQVSDNLFIAGDTLASTTRKADSDFTAGPLEQEVKGYLEPVSTVDGDTFFYTLNAKADGSKEKPVSEEPYVAYNPTANATNTTNYANKFSEDYDVTMSVVQSFTGTPGAALAYVDYVFQLKAVNSASVATDLKLTGLTLTYGVTPVTGSNAFRNAIFVEDISGDSGHPAGGIGTLKMIYAPTGAVNQTAGMAVKTTTTLDTVTYNTVVNLASVPASSVGYYKVISRLWIEGEDKSCTNETFAALTNSWSLALECSLGTSNLPVSSLATA